MKVPIPATMGLYPGVGVEVEQTSVVDAAAAAVWARAMTPEGINGELRPLLRMTLPRRARGVSIDEVPIGEVVGRSWILLFGVLPVEYDDLRLVELEPGRRFLERSSMATLRVWQHERIVEPDGERSCRVTDRLGLELRRPLAAIPGAGRLARAIVAALFRHRHRRLADWASAAAGS
jgi:ligand-binding SRPBCC domain-containing protein